MRPNRLAVLLTPVFAGLAMFVFTLAAKYLPVLSEIPKEQVAHFTLVVGGAAAAALLSWLHGWKQFERFEQELDLILAGHDEPVEDEALSGPGSGEGGVVPEPPLPSIEELSPAAQAAVVAAVKPSGQL